MKKNLVFMLVALFMFSCTVTGLAAAPFTDLPAKHWAYEAVDKLAKANLIEGYGDGTFRGDKAMSRYEIAFMTARSIEKYDRADAQQKAIIDKLSAEFATELNKMGLRVAKVEAKTNSWVSGFDMRARYHVNNPQTPGGTKLKGADTFDWRGRVYVTGQVNENWKGNIRFTTTGSNRFGAADAAGAFGSTAAFDIFNLQGKNIMGIDGVRLGRNWFTMGNGLMNKAAAVDGLWLNEKFGKTDAMFFIGNDKPAISATSDAQTFGVGQLSWKLQDNLKVGATYYATDMQGTSKPDGTGLLMADNGAAFSRSTGFTLFANYKFSGMTLLGEYVQSSLKDAVNMSDNPKGWSVQLTNGKSVNANYFFGNVPLVDLKKVGDTAWLVNYRNIESGATPPGLGGFDAMAIANAGQGYNVFTKGTDNVKGWLISLEKTVDKNMTVNLTVQDLSIVDRSLTTRLTKDKLDTTTCMMVNFWF